MAHIEKYQQPALKGMTDHYARVAERERGFERENIDPARMGENYNLAPDRGDPLEFIQARIESLDLKRKPRSNAVRLCDCIVTLPRDCKPEDEPKFFRATEDFLSHKWGVENVVSAWVHKDEAQPHLHHAWVPVTEDGRLSAKDVVSRGMLRSLHKELNDAVDAALGYHVSVLLGDEQRAEKELSHLDQGDYVAAKELLAEQQAQIAANDAAKVAKQGEIRALDGEIAKKRTYAAGLAENIAEKTRELDGLAEKVDQFYSWKDDAELKAAEANRRAEVASKRAAAAEEAKREAEEAQRAQTAENERLMREQRAQIAAAQREVANANVKRDAAQLDAQLASAKADQATERLERLRGRERAAEDEVAALRARIALVVDAQALGERIRGLRSHCGALVARIAATRPARAVLERVAVICRSINLPHPLVTEEEEAFVVARPTRRQETQVRREPKVRPQERQRALSPEEMRAAATREAARQSGVFNHGNGGNVVRGWGR